MLTSQSQPGKMSGYKATFTSFGKSSVVACFIFKIDLSPIVVQGSPTLSTLIQITSLGGQY